MSIPTLTLRTLKNRNSGIDISVPSVQETEAPLGGTSTEYEITVVTNFPIFKTQLHTREDVVQFSVYKAYREVEDLYIRLQKKLSLTDLPPIPHGNKILVCTTQEKQKALENFFMFIAQSSEICGSSIFSQFIGIPTQKQQMPSQNIKTSLKNTVLDEETKSGEDTNKKEKSFLEDIWPVEKEIASLSICSENDLFNSAERIIAENARKESDLECTSNTFSVIMADPLQKELHESIGEKVKDSNTASLSKNNSVDDDDLFEEVKRQKETKNKETQMSENNQKSYKGLFDDIDDGRSNLFGVSSDVLTSDRKTYNVQENKDKMFVSSELSHETPEISDGKYSSSKNAFDNHDAKPITSEADEKPMVQDKKLGDISLFGEQDFGGSITTDEEPLFLVSRTDDGNEKKKNLLLVPKLEASAGIQDESSELSESLDDLLNLTPLPDAPVPSRKEFKLVAIAAHPPEVKKKPQPSLADSTNAKKSDHSQDDEKEPQSLPDHSPEVKKKPPPLPTHSLEVKNEYASRPVPMPRSKLVAPKPAAPMPAAKKPEVQPRTVFLSKPSVPPKPVPPPKPKPGRIPQKDNTRNISTGDQKSSDLSRKLLSETQKQEDSASSELSRLDLLQYIENEKKLATSEASLFD